jgi:hypothetical protein
MRNHAQEVAYGELIYNQTASSCHRTCNPSINVRVIEVNEKSVTRIMRRDLELGEAQLPPDVA